MPDVNTTSLGSSAPSAATARVEISGRDRAPGRDEVVPADRGRIGLAAQEDRALERGKGHARVGEQGGVVGIEEPAHGEERPGAAAVEDVRRLGALEAGVDRHEHAARGSDAERGDDPLRRVGCPHRDPVTRLDARREQGAGGIVHEAAQRCEVDPAVAVDDRLGRAGSLRRRGAWPGSSAP